MFMATVTKKSAKKPKASTPAMAFHGSTKDGTKHVVGIGNLRVMIVPDGDFWFAQGMEIDYAAQGSSLADVKKKFEAGLRATIHEHLRIYGNIEKILRVAPTAVWQEFVFAPPGTRKLYSQLSMHELSALLPFQQIEYIEQRAA
jgi:hypothetical protein